MTAPQQAGGSKVRPILFSSPMIRALLGGRKTQTRRVIKLPTSKAEHLRGKWEPSTVGGSGCFDRFGNPAPEQVCIWNDRVGTTLICDYGKPGDLLWVREPWRVIKDYDAFDSKTILVASGGDMNGCVDFTSTSLNPNWVGRRRHARFMPRWASRLTLELTDVRIQRLQEISEQDAFAEGIIPTEKDSDGQQWYSLPEWDWQSLSASQAYKSLWESINGEGSWDANPWVWVISFRVHQQNVDALLRERTAA